MSSFPEYPQLSFPVTAGDIQALNRYIFQARRLLAGQITTANQRAQLLDLVIQWPNTTTPSVRTNPVLTQRPKSVQLADLRIGTAATEPATLAATLEWDWQNGSILLPQFVNGTLTTRWAVRLLVTEE